MFLRSTGFVALFFILSIAISLAGLVFLISELYTYEIQLADQYRHLDNARSAALYCKDELYSRLLLDPGYQPVLSPVDAVNGQDRDVRNLLYVHTVQTPHGESCRFVAYTAHTVTMSRPDAGMAGTLTSIQKNIQADIEGFDRDGSVTYKLRYTLALTSDLTLPILEIESIEI